MCLMEWWSKRLAFLGFLLEGLVLLEAMSPFLSCILAVKERHNFLLYREGYMQRPLSSALYHWNIFHRGRERLPKRCYRAPYSRETEGTVNGSSLTGEVSCLGRVGFFFFLWNIFLFLLSIKLFFIIFYYLGAR